MSTTTMQETEIQWSDYRDWKAGHATVREAIERSPHREGFMRVLAEFAAKTNSHEHVTVLWWDAPFVYIDVTDSRYHYPCSGRALISFDLAAGTFANWESKRRYVFARKGWGAFVDSIAHYAVPRYAICAEPTRKGCCAPPGAGWEAAVADTRAYDERREDGEGIVVCPECGTDEWDFTADRRARCKNGHEWEQQPDLPGTFVRPGYPGDINDPERFPGDEDGCE